MRAIDVPNAYRRRRRLLPSRRGLLRAAGGLAATAILAPPTAVRVHAAPYLTTDPFTLGVASGEPMSDGFVIWTRLAPDPFDPEALPPAALPVVWEVATDERMRRIVRHGMALAHPALGHSVHIELRGLEPDREYFYRFRSGAVASRIGRARTLPVIGQPRASLRLAVASCQHYEHGYYAAYRHMVEADPDLILHLGDYIYEASYGPPVRRHEGLEAITLGDYRMRHALYKLDRDLQAAHAATCWLIGWDDHEVDNDYAGALGQDDTDTVAFLARRAAAYQAFYEHMPLRRSALPRGDGVRLHQRYDVGDLATFYVLDGRQYRSDQACRTPEKGGGRMVAVADCPSLADPQRTMLGLEQEAWLRRGLARPVGRWTILTQQTLFAPLDSAPGTPPSVWSDGWSGYAPARQRLLDDLATLAPPNPVILGGDMHAFWVTDVHRDGSPAAPVVASEFVGSSISSAGPPAGRFEPLLAANPHVRHFDRDHRGYLLCSLGRRGWRTDLIGVDDVRDPSSGVKRLKSFHIESGRVGTTAA